LNHPGQPRVSKRHFEDCLTTDFPNLKFSKPKSDTCKYCDNNIMRQRDSSLTEASLRELVRELATHQLKAQRDYEMTSDFKDSAGDDNMVICMDLMQAMPTP
ncbi:unnamed protein product, partial [Meganyctiphanes norvegica]